MRTLKNRRSGLIETVALAAMLSLNANAQLTWDPDADQVNNGGGGIWDTTNLFWDDDGSAPNVTWSDDSDAVFGDGGGDYTVDIADGGILVGDLTYSGTSVLQLKSVTDDAGLISIKTGGATWDTGGGEIEFFNDNNGFDTPLSMGADTLAVIGGGTFDTGQNPGIDDLANWLVDTATLDVTTATNVRGNARSIGQFATVKLAGGSRYIHERNVDESYANSWELGAGTVAFDNRWSRNVILNGDVSGDGGIKVEFFAAKELRLFGTNTFSGGLEISTGSSVEVNDNDGLGTGDITLSNGGILQLVGVDMGSTRQLVLVDGETSGGSIINAGVNAFGGKITGDGDLSIGNAAYAVNQNTLTLTGTASDYTGDTTIHTGRIQLGVDNALPTSTVVTIGGLGTCKLLLNGFSQTIGGLNDAANNARQVANTLDEALGTAGALTIDVADGEQNSYLRAFGDFGSVLTTDSGNFSVTKDGLGSQILGLYNISGATTVNVGSLQIGDPGNVAQSGDLSVSEGNLTITGRGLAAPTFFMDTDSTASINFTVNDWAGLPQAGYTQVSTSGSFEITGSGGRFTIVIDDANLTDFVDSTESFTIVSAGTLTAATSDFTIDDASFTIGVGTWSADVVGNEVVLTYTSVATPYSTWAAANGLATPDAGENDDKDNDGIENILEWVLGGDPLTSDTGILPTATRSGTDLIFSFDRADSTIGSVSLTVQYGSDLIGWIDVVVPDTTEGIFVITENGTTDGVVATIPLTAVTEQFVRLKAE